MECVFCKIANKEVPAEIVYEDENVIAFLDISPAAKGHTLVVPKEHFEDLTNVPEEIVSKVIRVVKRVTKALKSFNDGVNVLQNNGKAAGQLIPHIHFHIIPRKENDNLEIAKWKANNYDNDEEMKAIAKMIKENL